MRFAGVVLAVAALVLNLVAPACGDSLRSIDVYGTGRLTAEQVREQFGTDIKTMVDAFERRDLDRFITLSQKVTETFRSLGPFAFAKVSLIQYFIPEKSAHVTVDVVEEQDRARRMDFIPPPRGTFPDPDGLLALWGEYAAKGNELQQQGQLKAPIPAECPAFHCIYGFDHPQLKPYLARLDAGARKHRKSLIRILRSDRDEGHRANAPFILAHTADGPALVRALVPAMRDASGGVRNNVMRVLAMVSLFHPKVAVPLEPVLKAIDYPETTDRNKALYILDGLAGRPDHHARIARDAGPALLRLLRLSQPNNHDPAWSVLKKISGEKYAERDYASWEHWLASVHSATPAMKVRRLLTAVQTPGQT